ncbi:hypothetical protein [Nocardioides ungokensis]|uniref:hypothetical protein n=1 Tax=Nocardioides ungokensis TaxID=1643322 RepID=UPI001FEA9DD7|nr:hypothetical protein [Nocardioides ungokensis]
MSTDEPDPSDQSARAIAAAVGLGLPHTVTRHGPVRSLQEAAAARGWRRGKSSRRWWCGSARATTASCWCRETARSPGRSSARCSA